MINSLVKYANRGNAEAPDGKRLHWDRVRIGADNLPFRGDVAPLYKEEEFEQRVTKVADFRNCFFDTSKPDDNKKYLDVMECCFNGWFQLVHLDRFWVDEHGLRTRFHYVEWAEFYLEDGSRTPAHAQGIQELAHGQQHVA